MRVLPALALTLALSLPGAALADDTAAPPAFATLVADSVTTQPDGTLVAAGHVQVLYKGARLSASRITYDQKAGRLLVEGPLVLVDPDGHNTLLADSADLSADLRNGILESARMVLDQQVQMAASRVDRVDGRYTQLTNSVTSSCQVCAAHPVPLWEIRAKRVIHDQVAQEVYFQDAQLRFAGVPVFYLPSLRLPDPTVKRAPGFLVPSFTASSTFGTALKLPYFLPLGPSRDLWVEPFIGTKSARTVSARYRQAFDTGAIEFDGAISHDAILPGRTRGYFFGSGNFALTDGFRLQFQIQTVSDPDYFVNYGLTQVDRLATGVDLSRTRRDEYIDAKVLHFHSIRSGDDNSTMPTNVASADWVRRYPGLMGGMGTLSFRSLALVRSSNADIVGRDVSRAGVNASWQRSWLLPGGLIATAEGALQSDLYNVAQDSTYSATILRTLPQVATELRWPLVKGGANGSGQVLEPVAQLIWSPKSAATVPNEDSQLSELDEGNLWSLSHFSGIDGVETGLRANLGLAWTRYAPGGWTLGVTAGRIYRQVDPGTFDPASGLGAKASGWLVATQARWQDFNVINRVVFGDGNGISKEELRLEWSRGRTKIGTSYLLAAPNPSSIALSTLPSREWLMDATYPIRRDWTGRVAWRYDFVAKRADASALAFTWRNECISVDLSLSRLYASSTSVAPTTTFGFSVGLVGFGGGTAGPSQCRQ